MLNEPLDFNGRPAYARLVLSALTVAICVAWILPGLLGHDPWKPDEAYTFGLVYHILDTGRMLVPTLAHEPFLERPPLYVASAALLAQLFSGWLPLHDGARLASGLYMALTLALVAATGRELYGPNRGWVSALLLLGSLGLLVRAHQLLTDVAQLTGFAMSAYGLALSLRRPVLAAVWLGLGVGVAFMSKGLLAPGILGLSALALFAGCRAWRTRRFVTACALALLLASPWLLIWPWLLYQHSTQLFEAWLWNDDLVRLFDRTALSPSTGERLHYLAILPWYGWPTLPLALWVLWGTRLAGFDRPAIQLPLVLFAVTLAVLSTATDGRELHAMPMLVPLALLATPAIDTLRRGASNALYWFAVMGFTFFAGIFWIYWSALELGVPARLSAHMHKLVPGYESGLRWVALSVSVALTIAWLVLITSLKRIPERPIIVWAAGVTLLWGMLTTVFIDYLDTSKSYRGMISSMQATLPARYDCIASRSLGEAQRAMLHYHAGIVTYRSEVPERRRDCELMLIQSVPAAPPDLPYGWRQIWQGNRPGDRGEMFWLYARGS